MKKNTVLFILLILFVSTNMYGSEKPSIKAVTSIPITNFNTTQFPMSDFFENVDMIPLEYTDACILGDIKKIAMSKEYLFVLEYRNSKGVYMFDHSGKFIRRIGNQGSGRDSFVALFDFSLNESSEQIHLFDQQGKRVLVFSFDGEFIDEIKMNYYASQFEYLDGLFYMYRESTPYGDPLFELVVKDGNGGLIEKYYPMVKGRHHTSNCVLRKTDNDILFVRELTDSIFALKDGKLSPKYFIDYKERAIPQQIRDKIKQKTYMQFNLTKKNDLAGIYDVFEVHNKVFVCFTNVFSPMMAVYDKTTRRVKSFYHFLNDISFTTVDFPIGQYKDYLISIKKQDKMQATIDVGLINYQKKGLIKKKKAEEIKNMIESRFPDRNSKQTNPIVFLMKVKK